MSLIKKQRRLDTSGLVSPAYLPSGTVITQNYEQPPQIRIYENGETGYIEVHTPSAPPQERNVGMPQYLPAQQQQQQQQPPPQKHQESYVTKTLAADTTVLQHSHIPLLRLCLIPLFVVIICLLLIAIFWNIQHNSPTAKTITPHSVSRNSWSNTSNEAVRTGKVYSIFYPYTITVFDDWEQIPHKGGPGIPGMAKGDFSRLLSMHSCCRTKKHLFICANTNRIDGAAFDIRLIEENDQVYLQVFPVTKLLVGAECKLELELSEEN